MRGFSLVELSIVLVILGLLTGGILAGQSLIAAAEMRKVTQQASKLHTAIYSFRDKYFALPGDMTNAFAFWGTATGCTNAAAYTVAAGCNGNGDGFIRDGILLGEDLRAFQFMALAGLIEGSYTGLAAVSGSTRQFGVNMPAAQMDNAGWWVNDLSTAQFGKNGNNLTFGREGTNFPTAAALSPEQLWNIDSKLDDGKPSSGRVGTMEVLPTCHNGTDYILTTTSIECIAIYWLQ